MASYPTSVKTFTLKANGGTLDASHINDLQDEVNALEGGLLNGTARVNSSHSTFVALSVTGGSTFAGRPVMPPPHAAKVFLDSTKTLGSSANSTLAWLAQEYLLNSSMHSTGTNPERLTPQSSGLYQVSAQVAWTVGDGTREVLILDSSATRIAASQVSSGPAALWLNVTGYKYFDAVGGYAVCAVAMSGASTLSVSTGSGLSWFAMTKL